MIKTATIAFALFFALIGLTQDAKKIHPDYVPDERTAQGVAEAVLIGQYGEKRVKAQLPLMVAPRGAKQWIVQGTVLDSKGRHQVGGGFGVLLNRHDGCVLEMVEEMK